MTALSLAAGHGQGIRQIGELLLAFVLSSTVGLERQLRGKSAGLRTQTIVGTSSALILLVSKYGFADVLAPGQVVLDPSRVAAQVVSGIGFLGAGLIITRRGAIRGLTTAAAVWETAAIGMAAGAGLPLLAVVVTVLHFVIVLVYTPLGQRLGNVHSGAVYSVIYEDGRGVLRDVIATCTTAGWSITSLATEADVGTLRDLVGDDDDAPREVSEHRSEARSGAIGKLVGVTVELAGVNAQDATGRLAMLKGVRRVDRIEQED